MTISLILRGGTPGTPTPPTLIGPTLSGNLVGANAILSSFVSAPVVYGNVVNGNTANLSVSVQTPTVNANLVGNSVTLSGAFRGNTANLSHAIQTPTVYGNLVGNSVTLTGTLTAAMYNFGGTAVTLSGNLTAANVTTSGNVIATNVTATNNANVGGYIINSYFQRAMVNQAMQTHYNAEIIRSMGSSGLCTLRSYRTDMSLITGMPNREFHVRNSGPVQTIHSHPENEGVLGLAELTAIVNGFYIRTQHNDPRLLDASNQMLIAPPLPSAVLNKPTGVSYSPISVTNNFDTTTDTQARYIKNFFTDPASLRSAQARLDMLYFEVWLEDASASDNLSNAQESSRHYDLANSLTVALKRVLEQTTPGGKDGNENVSFKSGLTVNIGTDGRPQFCALNFRIRAATVGTMETRVPRTSWTATDDPPEMSLSIVAATFGGTHGHEVLDIPYNEVIEGDTRVLDYLMRDDENVVYVESQYNSATVAGKHSHLHEVSWDGTTFVLRDVGSGSSGSDGSTLPTPFTATNVDSTKASSATNPIYAPLITRYRTWEGVWVGDGVTPAVVWTNANPDGTARNDSRPHHHPTPVSISDSRFPYDPFKAANGVLDNTNRFTIIRDEELLTPGETWEEYADSNRARYAVNTGDYRTMVSKVWGMDGIDAKPLYDTFGDTYTLGGTRLNMAKYNRAFGLPSLDASGRQAAPRGFNDPHLNVARTTNPTVVGGYTYMIPLEIVVRTPLESWNPYGILRSFGTTMRLSKSTDVGGGYAAIESIAPPSPFPLGSGYRTVPTVTVTPNGSGSGAIITALINGTNAMPGSIIGFKVVNGGAGYLLPPTVTVTGGSGTFTGTLTALVDNLAPTIRFRGGRGAGQLASEGTNAAATAVINASGKLNLTLTAPGSGYVRSPQVFFEGGSGDVRIGEVIAYIQGTNETVGPRPTGQGSTGLNTIVGTFPWGSGYATAPSVVITPTDGGKNAAAVATINATGSVTAITITARGVGYLTPPLISIVGSGTPGTTTFTATVQQPWSSNHPVNDNSAANTGGHYMMPSGLIDQIKADAADTTSNAARWVKAADGNAYPLSVSGLVASRPMASYTYPSGAPLTNVFKFRMPCAPVWMDSSQSSVRLRATNAAAAATRTNVAALTQAAGTATVSTLDRALESTWTVSTTDALFIRVAWSPELELFAAVGTNGRVGWSTDGLTWTQTTQGTSNRWGITWSRELAVFVAVGVGAPIVSTNGKTWQATALPVTVSQIMNDVAAGADAISAVTGAGSSTVQQYTLIAMSNPATIAMPTINAPTFNGYGVTASSGTGYLATNDDVASVWTPTAMQYTASFMYAGTTSTLVQGLGSVRGEYLQISLPTATRVAKYSIRAPTLAAAPHSWVLAGSNDGSKWVRLDARGYASVLTTPTEFVPAPGIACSMVRLIVTKVQNATAPQISEFELLSQPDVLVWNAEPVPPRNWYSVAWSPELRLWVAVAVNAVAWSVDARSWTLVTRIAGNWYSVTWSPVLGMFAAVSNSGGLGNKVATSVDGKVWKTHFPHIGSYDKIVWAKELGAFVATGYLETNGGKLLVSQNGLEWRTVQGPLTARFRGLAWSPELSVMAAVTNVGSPILAAATAPIAPAAKSTLLVSPAQVRYEDNTLNVNGGISLSPGASQTPVENGTMSFEFTSNTLLTIRARGTDGVLRSTALPLA